MPCGLILANLNGDGNLDIVVSSVQWLSAGGFGDQPSNMVSVLSGDGHGTFGNAHVYRVPLPPSLRANLRGSTEFLLLNPKRFPVC